MCSFWFRAARPAPGSITSACARACEMSLCNRSESGGILFVAMIAFALDGSTMYSLSLRVRKASASDAGPCAHLLASPNHLSVPRCRPE